MLEGMQPSHPKRDRLLLTMTSPANVVEAKSEDAGAQVPWPAAHCTTANCGSGLKLHLRRMLVCHWLAIVGKNDMAGKGLTGLGAAAAASTGGRWQSTAAAQAGSV